MGLFKRKKQNIEPADTEERGRIDLGGLFFNGSSVYTNSQALRLSAVYCAVNQISNSCGVLPINIIKGIGNDKETVYDHNLSFVLNGRVDGKNNHFNFFKQMIESVLLKGAGYALIVRDSRLNVKQLVYINYDYVTPMPQDDGTVKYQVNGANRVLDADEILDFHMHVDDMHRGISVLKYANKVLETAYEADNMSLNFFKSGGNLSGVLKPSAPMTKEQREQAQEAWRNSFERNGNNRVPVVILPSGIDFQPISVDPDDAQLLESRKFSIEEIARFFGLPPFKIYANMTAMDASDEIESLQSLYLVDTILPLTTMLSEEMSQKLVRPSERGRLTIDFDYSAMYRTDKKSEAEYYRTLVTNGIMTINEVRAKLDLPANEGDGCNVHFMQLSYANADDIASGAYIHQTEQDPSSNVKNDNKVKENKEE